MTYRGYWIWTDDLRAEHDPHVGPLILSLRRSELAQLELIAYAAVGRKLVAAINGDKPCVELFVENWTSEVGQLYPVLVRR